MWIAAVPKPSSSSATADDPLLATLRAVRRHVAAGIPAYMVFNDATLREMARRRPTSRQALLAVPGVGSVKADRYGDAFLRALREAV